MRSGSRIIILLLMAFAIAAVVCPARVQAQPVPQGQPSPQADTETGISNSSIALPQSVIKAKKSYTYHNADKRDPFESLILEKVEAEEGQEPLDPRESYDIEVMKVVAIIHTLNDSRGYASILLPDGKYYSVVKGTKIGIHGGRVDEILADRLIVKQTKIDFRRREYVETREIRLREEEE